MQLTERDYRILHTVYRYDGMLSIDQLHRWFFGVKRRAYYRISALCEGQCLQRLTKKDRHRVPEPIVWLGKVGAQILADYIGIEYRELRWSSQPRWSRVSHDIALNEFRHTFEQALLQYPAYELDTWYGQNELERLFPAPLPYLDVNVERKKLIKADGYVCVRVAGKPSFHLRFLVELDNNTEAGKRFGQDKVSPLVHLIHSPQYQQQTGGKSGRVIVVTVGSETRFHNLRSEVTKVGGAQYFLFTRHEWLQPDTILTHPIFYLPHTSTPFSFAQYHTEAFQVNLERSLARTPQLKLLF